MTEFISQRKLNFAYSVIAKDIISGMTSFFFLQRYLIVLILTVFLYMRLKEFNASFIIACYYKVAEIFLKLNFNLVQNKNKIVKSYFFL